MAEKKQKDKLNEATEDVLKQISGQDATFLYAESASSPMHIGSLTIIEGSLNYEDFKGHLASKIHLMPKFRQRLLNVPMNLDYPYWVNDPNFDIDLHVSRIKLPDPSNWKTLREVTASIFSRPLDLRRPLWSIDFVEGVNEIDQLPKGSVALVVKTHHVMIDGSSGVGIMGLLFDKNKSDEDKVHESPKPYEPEPLPDELSLLIESSKKFLKDPLKIPKTISETAYAYMKSGATNKLVKKKRFKSGKGAVPKTIFNNNVSPKRTWGTAILDFKRIYALRKATGVTINDLIIAICAGAIRRYLVGRNKLPAQSLVANVPISIRDKSEKQEMNNQISNMLIRIGTHIEDPLKRLEFINDQTDRGKTRHKTIGAKTLSKMADSVPFGLANLAAKAYNKYNIKDLHRPPFNVTITNVPGPNGALYLKTHKVVSVFGLTPVLDGFGLIIAAFSYNGQVTITTTSDANTMPDADRFSRYVRESANELEELIKNKPQHIEKVEATKAVLKCTPFFDALRKYIKLNPEHFKAIKGIYEFKVVTSEKEAFWKLDTTKPIPELRKQKASMPSATVEINDDNLYALHKKDLRLEELKIQSRIQFSGTKTGIKSFEKLMLQFLNR